MATSIETMAAWAASLAIGDVPADVLDLARAQRRSVLGAVAASAHDPAAGRVLAAFSFAPIRGILGGLGEGWTTKTLCVKPYPGCAYIDTTVDALHDILAQGPIDPDHVEEVRVGGSMLTTGMNALSAQYADIDPPTPVTINFNIPWNAAIMLLAGRLTEDETHPDWLAANATALGALRRKVHLEHDAELTAAAAAGFGSVIPAAALAKELGMRRLTSAARKVRAEHPGTGLGVGDVLGLVRSARSSGGDTARLARNKRWWDPAALDRLAVTFPARVTVKLKGGEERTARCDTPRGGAGNADAPPEAVARVKLDRSGPRMWGAEGTAAIQQAIDADDAKLYGLLGLKH